MVGKNTITKPNINNARVLKSLKSENLCSVNPSNRENKTIPKATPMPKDREKFITRPAQIPTRTVFRIPSFFNESLKIAR